MSSNTNSISKKFLASLRPRARCLRFLSVVQVGNDLEKGERQVLHIIKKRGKKRKGHPFHE